MLKIPRQKVQQLSTNVGMFLFRQGDTIKREDISNGIPGVVRVFTFLSDVSMKDDLFDVKVRNSEDFQDLEISHSRPFLQTIFYAFDLSCNVESKQL